MQTFELPAPAKLNRFLHITGRRADGYHELQTVFQLVEHSDVLTFGPSPEGISILMAGEGENMRAEDNLAHRAALLLSEGRRLPGVRIGLNKRIPIGSGMGGGSSDAATALHGLNIFWHLGLSVAELAALGLQLGADVPVFVAGQSSWAEGIGEVLSPIELPETWFVVLVPESRVSTAEVFAHPDLTRDSSVIKIARFLGQGVLRNDCEGVARTLCPEIGSALDWLSQWGPARMTGTGAGVFLETQDEAHARDVLAESLAKWQGFVTRGAQQSSLITALDQVKESSQN